MVSATSFFNPALFRKALTRFWAVWLFYGLFWLFALPLRLLSEYLNQMRYGRVSISDLQSVAADIPDLLPFGVALSCVAGVVAAMAVFGYLYNNRSACMIHALPVRREELFITFYLAGLALLLLPHLVVGGFTVAVELLLFPSSQWIGVLQPLLVWFLAQSATCLFFFSFAAFCAMFTGHILALPIFYGILNILVFACAQLASALMGLFFYGFSMSNPYRSIWLVRAFTPVGYLIEGVSGGYGYDPLHAGLYTIESWSILCGYAVAAVVLAVLAVLVYKQRHIESAGDVVAIAWVRPIFVVGVSACTGAFFGTFCVDFLNLTQNRLVFTVLFVLWGALGYAVAEMFLLKTFRILHKWRGCAITLGVMTLVCIVCFFDLFGIAARVPNPTQVESVVLNASFGYPNDSGSYQTAVVTDPDQIEVIVAAHQAIAAQGRPDREIEYTQDMDTISFCLTYTLKGGKTLERAYYSVPVYKSELGDPTSVTAAIQRLVSMRDLVALVYGFRAAETGQLMDGSIDDLYNEDSSAMFSLTIKRDDLDRVWAAMTKDFAAGNIGVRYLFNDEQRQNNTYTANLSFVWRNIQASPEESWTDHKYISITLTPQAVNTLAVLEEIGTILPPYRLMTSNESNYERSYREVTLPAAIN